VATDPVDVVGLLADRNRRKVVAAIILGASTMQEITEATGMATRPTATAVARLVEAGLVDLDRQGGFTLVDSAFVDAARAAAATRAAEQFRPRTADEPDAPPEAAKVLRAFVRNGRLTSIPAQKGKRLVVLDLLAQEFEPGRRYSEREVVAVLSRWHDDHAALRRYLVDDGLLDRHGGEYWRTGGTYLP
jgi:hypothetical protein